MKTTRTLLCIAAAAALPATLAVAGDKDTAAYYKVTGADHVGQVISLDVAVARAHPAAPVSDGFTVFSVHTWNDRTDTRGGAMLAVVPVGDAESFARRYGTSVEREWDRGDGVEVDTKRLRGTLRAVETPRSRTVYYLDLTDGAFVPTEDFIGRADIPDSGPRRPARP